MENIKLSSRDKPGHHHRSIGNLHVLLPSHRQTSHHSHRQRLTLTIGTNALPLLDLVIFSCFFIGNHPHRQLSCRPVIVALSCRSTLYRSWVRVQKWCQHMPPISEYEIINAPKFSAVMMPSPAINAPNLVTDNLNLDNSDPNPPQIPRNPQLPKRASFLVVHRQQYRYKDLPML